MKKTITDLDVQGKRVFVRADFNVPLDKEGTITDDTRIKATLPTIQYLLGKNAKIILASHLGRPKGQIMPEYSLKPVAKRLSELLNQPIELTADCVGETTRKQALALGEKEILLLENLRFHSEEEKNDPEFSRQLGELAEVGVNDAFGVSHRAHASVEGITHYLPMVAGFLLEKEIKFVGGAVMNPKKPFAAIIGGAKVSDKINVIANLLPKVDVLIIGGGMANTFIAAKGYEIGKSLIEVDKVNLAKSLLEQAKTAHVNMLIPVDVVVADRFAADAVTKIVAIDSIPADMMALDIGPQSSELFAAALQPMHMIIWNGPMGVFEMDAFAKGTEAVAKAVAAADAVTIVGGGDSIAAIEKTGLTDKITHISTGGGASLEYLEGKTLPGIAALAEK